MNLPPKADERRLAPHSRSSRVAALLSSHREQEAGPPQPSRRGVHRQSEALERVESEDLPVSGRREDDRRGRGFAAILDEEVPEVPRDALPRDRLEPPLPRAAHAER